MRVQMIKRVAFGFASVMLGMGSSLAIPLHAYALVGPHSYTDTGNGDVYLGGDYIELGISSAGSFGTDGSGSLPPGFYGADGRSNIGMSTNPAGFGQSPDLRMDFFLPGSPEERWTVGYTLDSTQYHGSNSLLDSPVDISDNAVVNQSSGSVLKATSTGTFNSTLKTTQVISFNRGDKYFKNEVTLKNVSSDTIDSVRYMRNVDPDNTVDQGGDYTTNNTILDTFAAGDGKAVVVADTSWNDSDPVYEATGSRSPLLYFSNDSRARVSTFGFDNEDPYDPDAYDSAPAKGTVVTDDIAINITFDVGTLAPGQSTTLTYYTSLDSGNVDDIINTISHAASGDSDNVSSTVEDAAPNHGDGNGDGIQDSTQDNVTSLPNSAIGGGHYETLAVSGGCTSISDISAESIASVGTDNRYSYPLGLTSYSLGCTTPGGVAHVVLYYDHLYNTNGWVARKYINHTFTNVPGAVFGTATVGSTTVTTLSYDVADGGPLDADGNANGTIVDPAGPAFLTVGAPDTGYGAPNQLRPILILAMAASILFVGAGLRMSRSRR